MITPSIWMKRDQKLLKLLQKWTIHIIRCMTNTQTNRAFHMQAQTPTCYFTFQKTPPLTLNYDIFIYDEQKENIFHLIIRRILILDSHYHYLHHPLLKN